MGHELECDLHATDECTRSRILPSDVPIIIGLGVIPDEVFGGESVEVVFVLRLHLNRLLHSEILDSYVRLQLI